MKNIEKIQQMSREELAAYLLAASRGCFKTICDGEYCGEKSCYDCVYNYLDKEAEQKTCSKPEQVG